MAERGVAENSICAAAGKSSDYRLYALLAPHLANFGYGNTGWVGDYKGTPMLFAQRDSCRARPRLLRADAENALSDLPAFRTAGKICRRHFQMTWEYDRAENGNIALTGEIDLAACNGEFVLALGFGGIWAEAGQQALSSLLDFLRSNSQGLRLALAALAEVT